MNENRDVIALQNEIAEDAKEWEEQKQDVSYLYSGAKLVNANEQLKSNKLVLSGSSFEFIRAGQARKRRGQVMLFGSITIIIAVLITTVIVFANLTREAQKQQKLARVGELSAESIALRDRNFQLSQLLGIEAYKGSATVQSRGTLLDNAQTNPFLHRYLAAHQDEVFSVAFSPDGKTLASGGRDKTIILWDVKSYQPKGQPFTGHSASVTSVVFSPDGSVLASGSTDKTVILWDIESHQPIGQLDGHKEAVKSVAFSPDGKLLASSSEDKTIFLWDVESRQQIGLPLTGHEGIVYSVAFSPDGKLLASGSEDKTIILWDVESHQPIGQFTGHEGSITSIAFSPDGKIFSIRQR